MPLPRLSISVFRLGIGGVRPSFQAADPRNFAELPLDQRQPAASFQQLLCPQRKAFLFARTHGQRLCLLQLFTQIGLALVPARRQFIRPPAGCLRLALQRTGPLGQLIPLAV